MHLATWKRGEKLTLSNSMTVHALFSNWPTFWQLQPIFSMTLRGHNPWIPKLSNPWQNADNPRGKPELSLDILHSEAVDHVLMQAAAAALGVLWWIDGRPSCALWWWDRSHLSSPKIFIHSSSWRLPMNVRIGNGILLTLLEVESVCEIESILSWCKLSDSPVIFFAPKQSAAHPPTKVTCRCTCLCGQKILDGAGMGWPQVRGGGRGSRWKQGKCQLSFHLAAAF